MASLMNLPSYQYPTNALLDFSPVERAIDTNNQLRQQDRSFGLQQQQVNQGQQRIDLARQQADREQAQKKIERVAAIAAAADAETDPTRRAAIYQSALDMHPNASGLPSIYHDPINGPKILMAEAAKYKDPLDRQKIQAEIDLTRARAGYYGTAGGALRAKAAGGAAPDAPAADPLAGYGMDENGNIIPPASGDAGGPDPRFRFPGTGAPVTTVGAGLGLHGFPSRPAGMMRLGGPVDQPDAPPAPSRPDGVQIAQTGNNWPALMGQAIQSPYGPVGVTAPEVPGIVTNGKGASDPTATRAADGQRAMEGATPEARQRLLKMRQDQDLWTAIYKRPPPSNYYYGPDGRTLPMGEKNYKGDREQATTINLNLSKLDEAQKSLNSQTFGNLGRLVSGNLNYGENARNYSDLQQAAMDIAYAKSGKQVGKAELENFMNAYAPQPSDSAYTMNYKIERMRQYYKALQGGVSPDLAWAKATANSGQTDKPQQTDPNVDRLRNKYGLE